MEVLLDSVIGYNEDSSLLIPAYCVKEFAPNDYGMLRVTVPRYLIGDVSVYSYR